MSRKPPPTNPNAASQGRNEYIPSFISKKPFYVDEATTDSDYLEHQRLQAAPKDTLDKARWYDRGRKQGPAATKFRKGACENCGAMTHKTKECLSRPRKQGAKWTGRDIQADEVVEDVSLGWDAKRDRWNGYDAREYSAVVKEYEELENLKRAAKGDSESQKQIDNNSGEDLRYGEETDMGRSQPTSTRQLRLREDTAAYLKDLNLETSAKYDPKTRTIDNSTQALKNPTNPDDPDAIVSEGFVRKSATEGDALEFELAQRYAWESQETSGAGTGGKKLHLQANPTEGEILRKKLTAELETEKAVQREALFKKYGDAGLSTIGAASTTQSKPIKSLESYIEYDETGKIKGQPPTGKNKSKYPEDILTNNHTAVWGSWWRDFQWGYACCHSTTKNSYCTGEAGRQAFEDAEKFRTGETLPLTNDDQDGFDQVGVEQQSEDAIQNTKSARDGSNDNNNHTLEEDTTISTTPHHLPPNKNKRPLSPSPSQFQQHPKEPFQEVTHTGVTEDEMERYKRQRVAADDPMARHLGRDELIPSSS